MTAPIPMDADPIPGTLRTPTEFSFMDVNTMNGFTELVYGPTADGDGDLD